MKKNKIKHIAILLLYISYIDRIIEKNKAVLSE